LSLILPYLLLKCVQMEEDIFEYIRIYFSFYLFYRIFNNVRIDVNILSIILIVIHYLEVACILFDIELIGVFNYNYADSVNIFGSPTLRPRGIFSNSTMSAGAYIIIMTLCSDKFIRLLLITCIITFLSGTAMIVLVLHYILLPKNYLVKIIGTLLLIILSLTGIFYKLSLKNISYNLKYKYDMFMKMILDMDIQEVIIGSKNLHYINDTGIILFFQGYGVYGLIVMSIFIFSKCNYHNKHSIIILVIISLIHYPFTAYAFGALILGLLLNYGYGVDNLSNYSLVKLTGREHD
jgi:hypothetical protein